MERRARHFCAPMHQWVVQTKHAADVDSQVHMGTGIVLFCDGRPRACLVVGHDTLRYVCATAVAVCRVCVVFVLGLTVSPSRLGWNNVLRWQGLRLTYSVLFPCWPNKVFNKKRCLARAKFVGLIPCHEDKLHVGTAVAYARKTQVTQKPPPPPVTYSIYSLAFKLSRRQKQWDVPLLLPHTYVLQLRSLARACHPSSKFGG